MLTETGQQWTVLVNSCAETLDVKRQKKKKLKMNKVKQTPKHLLCSYLAPVLL